MLLVSKAHTLKGFKFEGVDTVYPDWFTKEFEKGNAFKTINTKACHITLIDPLDNSRQASKGDWVCINSQDIMFPMTEVEINNDFTLEEE